MTVNYFKSFPDTLIPQFVKAFKNLISSPFANKDILEAHNTLVSNYRPISLLNVDVKLYGKILTNCLLPLLPRLVSVDQVGFIPGREARDNTTKEINIHYWLTTMSSQGFFLSHSTGWPGIT